MTTQRPKPLDGLKVLDLTRLLPGPVATMHLADMGADVLKIEEPGIGDYARSMGPMRDRLTQFFVVVNRNKRFARMDLRQDGDRARFLDLAREADVVVESFRPGVLDRLGAGYDELRAVNERIVLCSVTGYGQTGPMRDVAGHDINYCALAGALDQLADADGAPIVANFQIADLLGGGASAVMGILAAVFDARTRGVGRHVDVSMTDSVLAHNLMALVAVNNRGAASRAGTDLLNGGVPCYGVYATSDGRHMAVGALEPKFWEALCDAIGRPDWRKLHWSRGQAVGGEDAMGIKRELAQLFGTRTQADWIAHFAGHDCCVTPVLRAEEALGHPMFAARDMALRVTHPTEGEGWIAAPPVKFSDDEFSVRMHAE